jgi:hypothetical protein
MNKKRVHEYQFYGHVSRTCPWIGHERKEQLATIIGKAQSLISSSLSINRLPKEIRDKCRQDPTVPRNVLLEIAQKK